MHASSERWYDTRLFSCCFIVDSLEGQLVNSWVAKIAICWHMYLRVSFHCSSINHLRAHSALILSTYSLLVILNGSEATGAVTNGRALKLTMYRRPAVHKIFLKDKGGLIWVNPPRPVLLQTIADVHANNSKKPIRWENYIKIIATFYIRTYSQIHRCSNRWVLYWREVVDSASYTTGSCKLISPISYLAYSVNYLAYWLITRTIQIGEYNI